MKKTMLLLISLVAAVALVAVSSSLSIAAVGGRCDGCHTMHNSQDGSGMEKFSSVETGPFAQLLRGSCIGCHAQNGSDTIDLDGDIPQIHHTDTNDLAGGNLDATHGGGTTDDAKGHNIEGIIPEDNDLSSTPPGYVAAYDPSSVDYDDSQRLTCAGSNGCHGDRDVDRSAYSNASDASFAAINGAHHGDDSMLKFGSINEATQGLSVASSYRFLDGIKGGEDDDWQDTEAEADHNEYKAAIYSTRNSNPGETISALCAQCHGNFHSTDGITDVSNTVWFRHPTDVVLTNSGEYAKYNPDNLNLYSTEAPVGRVTIPPSASSTVTPGTDVVLCISCHRAHGSDHDDILRWDYSTMTAGSGTTDTGCFTCHTAKNADAD